MFKYHPFRIVLCIIFLATLACEKETSKTRPGTLIPESKSFVVGHVEDSVRAEIYNPPIRIKADSSFYHKREKDSYEYDLDEDGFYDLRIVARNFSNRGYDSIVYYGESDIYIEGVTYPEIIHTHSYDTLYRRQTLSNDSVVEFNLGSGRFTDLVDYRIENWTYESWQNVNIPKFFKAGERVYYEEDSISWEDRGGRAGDLKESALFHTRILHNPYSGSVLLDDGTSEDVPYLEYFRYNLWSGKGKGYLIFRKEIEDQYLYGWLELEVKPNAEVIIYSMRTFYRSSTALSN